MLQLAAGKQYKAACFGTFWEGGALKNPNNTSKLDQVPTRIWGEAEGGSAVVWLQVALE